MNHNSIPTQVKSSGFAFIDIVPYPFTLKTTLLLMFLTAFQATFWWLYFISSINHRFRELYLILLYQRILLHYAIFTIAIFATALGFIYRISSTTNQWVSWTQTESDNREKIGKKKIQKRNYSILWYISGLAFWRSIYNLIQLKFW